MKGLGHGIYKWLAVSKQRPCLHVPAQHRAPPPRLPPSFGCRALHFVACLPCAYLAFSTAFSRMPQQATVSERRKVLAPEGGALCNRIRC